MRGTQRVGSLLRLFLGAAFLCLAWVLLSSTQADAAERPAPVELIASVAEPVTGSVAVAAPAPVREDPVAVVADTTKPVVAPVVEQLRATTTATVDAGAAGLKDVAAAVPVLEAPIVAVADDVVALTDAVPVVGRDPLVDVPLPSRPGTPAPVPLPELDVVLPAALSDEPANPGAKQHDSPVVASQLDALRGLVLAAFDADSRDSKAPLVAVGDRTPLVSGAPQPSELPEPWPSPQSPMPPNQSVPSPGGGASSVDLASIGPAIVLPSPTTWGRTSSDWRVPRGLPDRPGSRPD
jgi:hypothetical protein